MIKMHNLLQKNSKGQVWVNVASSSLVLEDFVNLENHLLLKLRPFVLFLRPFLSKSHRKQIDNFTEAKRKATLEFYNCLKHLPFPETSVDHILCSHFLEHVYYEEAKILIRNYYKVLKSGGTLHVIIPDLGVIAKEYVSNIGKQRSAERFLDSIILSSQTRPKFFVRLREFIGGFGHKHHWMYDEASMINMLEEVGFDICEDNESPSKFWHEDNNGCQVNLLARKP